MYFPTIPILMKPALLQYVSFRLHLAEEDEGSYCSFGLAFFSLTFTDNILQPVARRAVRRMS